MTWTPEQLRAYELRNTPLVREAAPKNSVLVESHLHESIVAYCNSNWPRWKYIRARMDRESTIAVGAQDFTIFMPGGRVLCVECKAKGKKRSMEQLNWAKEMEMLGHQVHLIYSFDEFLSLTSAH